MNSSNPRALPAVEKVLKALGEQPVPRPLVTNLVREAIQAKREAKEGVADFEVFVREVQLEIDHLNRARIQAVINGTGVLIHTNLGRSPIQEAAAQRMHDIAVNYNNLEIDLDSGARGKRGRYFEQLLAQLVDAEAATVVNNCASALILILRLFTANTGKKEVLISRGELVEIGGGFRVPEIMEASGATLREVGATNKTSLNDYARAIGPETAMLLKVHRSNFWMEGFVDSPTTEEMAALAHEHGLAMVEDLGSGAMVDTGQLAPIEHEPLANEILKRGVDLVCFSGDKIFGGPQAGMIAGKAELIAGLKKEPFFRALRCDKLILTLLECTAQAYLDARATSSIPSLPLLDMLQLTVDSLRERGEAMGKELAGLPVDWSLGESTAQVGGGTMPKSAIPSVTLDLKAHGLKAPVLAKRLRRQALPLMGYIAEDLFRLDLRTVFPRQDAQVVNAITLALS
ncbi:MAG: L-seryl-tRNA(Sec) selenium transferase [Verrucomicrobiaceae bacterium]|nr:L-seryl-tRNA(Sec) selenium transferase [Verrucomicrobiaceae bacterium]NCF94805.1 L-seryl-tRNA(Sec) selenium transferase [Verrucomicrobiaceae bacterium]